MTKEKTENIENPSSSSEKIEVSRGLLETLNRELQQLKKDRDALWEMADERKKASYYARNQQDLPKEVKLRTLVVDEKGTPIEKVVVGWRTIKDEVFKDPMTMRWQEVQIIEVILEDGTSRQMPLLEWIRQYKHKKSKIISRQTDEQTGKLLLKVGCEDGKEYQVGIEFVN